MQRPKPLPTEVLSDLAVSAATKLQRLRHLGRYFKQSSKAMEQQVSRDARFYGSLIRLQQNWKVKRQRVAAMGPGSEGFSFDLLDNSFVDLTALSRPSSISTVRVDHHYSGILSIQRPQKLCRFISLRFIGADPSCKQKSISRKKIYSLAEHHRAAKTEALTDEEVNECVKDTHSILCEIHQSTFEEQVFDMVNHETYNPLPGISVTGMREDFLQLAIGQETSVCLWLVPSGKEDGPQMVDPKGDSQNGESGLLNSDSMDLAIVGDDQHDFFKMNLSGMPNPVSLEIYLLFIFHENVLARARERRSCATRAQVPGEPADGSCGVLGHFCMTVAHRIFSNKVLSELESLVNGVPYLQLLSHPTWHSRTSSWSLFLKFPQSVLHAGRRSKISDNHHLKHGMRSQFHTKVVVKDDQINVSGEGAPSIICSFRGSSDDICSLNSFGCDLEDLPMILLQQVASQVIRWLHEEALVVGMKASRDFLCLYFGLDHGDTLGLVAHVDPDDVNGCISWWVVMDDGSAEGKNLTYYGESESRRFLGHLSLEALYATVMDLASLCSIGGIH
ncbi:mediator of RNA polymerase II transcription subunit 17 [Cocos nucifera]|nr:mediator of RNA polymerase II transcription subunit 17 [Cocos nucifera]